MKLFVSYASEFRAAADEVALALTGAGYDAIFDQSWLKPGDDYNSKIRDAFDQADGLVFLITPEAVQPGSYALTELKFARERAPSCQARLASHVGTHASRDDSPVPEGRNASSAGR